MWGLEWILLTPAACWDISRWYAHVFRAYHRITNEDHNRTPEGVPRNPRTPSGVRMLIVISLPGVRKRRVPLAKFPAPLRGASCHAPSTAARCKAQKTYFNASCMIRGSAAATDLPNDWLFRAELGFIGFTWFGALNASARNSMDCPSRI